MRKYADSVGWQPPLEWNYERQLQGDTHSQREGQGTDEDSCHDIEYEAWSDLHGDWVEGVVDD